MLKQIFSLVLLTIGFTSIGWTQTDDVLFTVDGEPVTVSEFRYIYEKSKAGGADYSKASVDEYLDLYTKFKLQVRKAKDIKLDTIPALKRELEGYRKQLASNYLLDKEVLDNLVKEAYERSQYDVSISHIFFLVENGADAEADKEALARANKIKKDISQGKIKFEEAAKEFSDDKPTGAEGGYLGFITAFYLKNFYQIENAAYNTKPGKISAPVRSKYGYHLVKVNEKRPARGQIEAAHILIRVENPTQEAEAQAKIRKIHKELNDGLVFGDAAKKHSEDETSAFKGGFLGSVTINKYEKTFEETIFRLQKDNDYSVPFRSSIGWHIVQRIKKSPKESLSQMERGLKARVQRDARFAIVQDEFTKKLKSENNFTEVATAKQLFTNSIDKSFVTTQWKAPAAANQQTPLFKINDETVSSAEFVQFLSKNANQRSREGRNGTPEQAFNKIYDQFVSSKLMEYEEKQLPKKYPEFKALMREYEEGILLFEAKNMMVWGKAAKDTVGLQNFYDKNKNNYLWEERVDATTYTMSNEHPTKLALARKLAKKKNTAKVFSKINKGEEILKAETKSYEKGQNKTVDTLTWKKGSMSENVITGETVSFVKIENIIKPEPKAFQDARGYVIADYQMFLEQQWIAELKKEYTVKINQDVVNNLIK
jgi:peptidyl-prolyl cis-trans isomerase SurA